jgi:hypothetical protein
MQKRQDEEKKYLHGYWRRLQSRCFLISIQETVGEPARHFGSISQEFYVSAL